MKGNTLVLNIGFSHQVEIEAEEGVKVETPTPNTIVVSGIDKERVGQMAALIRSKKNLNLIKEKVSNIVMKESSEKKENCW